MLSGGIEFAVVDWSLAVVVIGWSAFFLRTRLFGLGEATAAAVVLVVAPEDSLLDERDFLLVGLDVMA